MAISKNSRKAKWGDALRINELFASRGSGVSTVPVRVRRENTKNLTSSRDCPDKLLMRAARNTSTLGGDATEEGGSGMVSVTPPSALLLLGFFPLRFPSLMVAMVVWTSMVDDEPRYIVSKNSAVIRSKLVSWG